MASVSYIITVYNKAKFLPFAVEGLRRQRGRFQREYIFIDDGSDDESVEVIRACTSDLSNVTIVRQSNHGPSIATNVGLKKASGTYIKLVDADDVLFPWSTKILIEAQECTGCPVSYADIQLSATYDAGAADPAGIFTKLRRQPGGHRVHRNMLHNVFDRGCMTPTSWLARRDVVERTGGCDERVFVQDNSINMRLANLAPIVELREPVFMVPESLDGRISGNATQLRHDENMAIAGFLMDHPELPQPLRRFAFLKATRRVWRWNRDCGAKWYRSPVFWWYQAAKYRLIPVRPDLIVKTCASFYDIAEIRIPGDPVVVVQPPWKVKVGGSFESGSHNPTVL